MQGSATDIFSDGGLSISPHEPPVTSLLHKLRRRDNVSEEEASAIAALVPSPQVLEAEQDIVSEGERPLSSALLVQGLAARYKVMADGRRQITAIHVPGDFVDLHSVVLKEMDHGVTCLTRCRVSRVPHGRIMEISAEYPHIGRLFWLTTLVDGAIHREWLTGMGRRTAKAHLAHLLCELYTLLEVVKLSNDSEFLLPISQTVLADVLGLSAVHVNRVLQELRAAELISWQGSKVRILDWARLRDLAQFNSTYLNLFREPR